MTTVIVILILLLTLTYFYLKCTLMTSLSTMMLFIFSSVLSFSCYERLADLFVSRGYGVQWAHAGCFFLVFVLSFALFRVLRDLLVGGVIIDLGEPVKIGAAIICGLIAGIVISGNILVTIGMIPSQSKYLYSRYNINGKINPDKPERSFLNTDGFVTGLYQLISRGSMKSSKSFGVLHADYLSQIHLNRLHVKEQVLTVASTKSLKLPSGPNKHPVRLWNSPEDGELTIVRMGIIAKNIQSGGAGNPAKGNNIEFFPAQIRMICQSTSESKSTLSGAGKVRLPIGFLANKEESETGPELSKTNPEDIIPAQKGAVKNGILWLDVAFKVPSGYRGILLEFKQNALVELPAAVPYSDETEKLLNGERKSEKP